MCNRNVQSSTFNVQRRRIGLLNLLNVLTVLTFLNLLNVSPVSAEPVKLAIGGGWASISTGTCASFYVETRNISDQIKNVTVDTAVELDDGLPNAGYFYSSTDWNCAGTPISRTSFTAGSSYQSFYYKSDSTGNVVLKAWATLEGNKVYLIGGTAGSNQDNNQVFDPMNNTWIQRAPLPSPRYAFATAAANGKIFVIGGFNAVHYVSDNHEYDPVTNSWATRASLPIARAYFGAASINGKVYALGGFNGNEHSLNHEFDPAANAWITRAPVPTARFSPAIVSLNGKIYAIGGSNGGFYINSNEEFDPAANAWVTRSPMPTTRRGLAAAAAAGKIYAIGGEASNSARLTINEEFDPIANSWATRTPMSNPRVYLAAAAIKEKIYAMGGWNGGSNYSDRNEEFSPGGNFWSSRASLPQAVMYTAAAAGQAAAGLAVTITALPTQLSISGPNLVPAGACSPQFSVNSKDAQGNIANSTDVVNINLTDNGAGGTFYGGWDNTCTSAGINSINIPINSNVSSFYYRNFSTGTVVLGAIPVFLSSATKNVSLTGPTQLSVVGLPSTSVNNCEPYKVVARDSGGNPSPVTTATTIYLSSSGAGAFGSEFFNNSSCAGASVTQVSIATSTHTALFYFRKSAGGEVTLGADDGPGGLAPGSLNVTVAGLSKFVVSGSTSNFSGQCVEFTVVTRNHLNQSEAVNTSKTVYLTDGGAGGNFDTSPTCATSYGSVNIPVAFSSTTFYYRKNSTATLTITADDDVPGLMAGSLQVVFRGPSRLKLSGPASPSTTACSLYSLNTESDGGQFNVNVSAPLNVNLADSDAVEGFFYPTADTTCSGPVITSVTVPSFSSYADFRYKKATGGSVTLTASAPGLSQGNLSVNVGAVPSQLAWSGPASISVGQCVSYTISSRDSGGNLAEVAASSTVSISDNSGGSFYLTGTCTTAAGGSVLISAGSNSSSVHYRKDTPGSAVLTAFAAGLSTATLNVSVAGVSQLEISGSTSSVPGTCLSYILYTKTSGGQIAALSVSTTVSLSDSDSSDGLFYSDSGCAASITNVTMPSGYSSYPFYYRKNAGGVVTLTASAAGLNSANLGVSFTGPTKLVIEGPSVVITSACSPAFTIFSRSNSDVNTPMNVGTYVELRDGQVGGGFFSDYLCTGAPINSIWMAPAIHNANFYYRKFSASASINLQAIAPGLSTGTFNLVVSDPVGAVKVSITGPTSITENTCAAYTLTALNTNNSTAPVNSNVTLYLGDGGGGGSFYSDSICNSYSGNVTMSSGSHLASFYYKKSYSGTSYFFADDGADGLEPGNLTVTVTAGSGSGSSATQLSLSGPTSLSANSCGIYSVNSRDSSGAITNVVAGTPVTLSDSGGGGTFYSDLACATALGAPPQISIPPATNSSGFSYRRTTGGSNVALTASAASLSTATLSVTITSGGGGSGSQPTRLAIFGPATLTAGSCSSQFNVNSQDNAYLNANVAANTVVYLDDGGSGGTFYSDYSCFTPVTNVTIYAGNNGASFYYRRSGGGTNVNLKADDGPAGLQKALLNISITGGSSNSGSAVSYLSLTGPVSVNMAQCSNAYTVQAKDTSGNPVNVTTSLTINLSDGGMGGTFYSDSGCAASLSQISIPAAMNSANFYYRKAAAGNGYLSVSASSLGGSSLYVTVASGDGGAAADTFPPGQITNLTAQTGSEGVVVLQWTAPGDDDFFGAAHSYLIKFSTSGPVTSANWHDAHLRDISQLNLIAPAPFASGSQQSFTITGLEAGKTYWWAIRTLDEVPNVSLVSNSPSAAAGQSAANTASADADGKGTASISPANVPSCQASVTTITFTVDAASITAGGGIAVRIPDNWSWPQTYCSNCSGYISAVDNAGAVHSSVTVFTGLDTLGSQWFGAQVVAGKKLNAGDVLRLIYRDGWPQWQLGNGVVFETRVKGSSAGTFKKIASQPSVNVVAGGVSRISFGTYEPLTLGAGQASPAMSLRAEDACGNPTAAASNTTVPLNAKKWDGFTYVADGNASFSLNASDFSSPINQVTITAGQKTSPAFYYKTTTLGSAQVEVFYEGAGGGAAAAFYPSTRYLSIVAGSVGFSGLSVDNGSPGALSSVTITPNGDGSGDFATINFTPSDSSMQWRVLISSDNFTTNVFERYGSGLPYRSVIWDGKDFRSGRVVPNGTYTVRIDAGGGLGANSTLSINVNTAFITGTVTLDGTPLSGAQINISGWPMAYGSFVETGADGTYKVYGLKAGTVYSVSVNRTDPVTFRSVFGSANNITAALAGTTANIALGSPSLLRVNARLPRPAEYDLYGSVEARNASGTRFAYGSVRFAPGSLVSDSGGYSYAAAFTASASSWTSMDVSADTYTVTLNVYGFTSLEKQVFVGAGKTQELSFALSKRANIYGWVVLPSVSSFGTWVSVEGTKSGETVPSLWGGAWIPPSKSSAVYTLFGVSTGTYNLRAQAPGFASVSTGPITVAFSDLGTPDAGGVNFAAFGAGSSIQGLVRVIGNSTLLPYGGARPNPFQVYINAFNALSYIGSYASPMLPASLTESSGTYALTGLDSGASYQLTAFLDGFELDPPGPKKVTVPSSGTATLDLTFRQIDAQFKLGFILPSGRSDYNRISVNVSGPGISNPVIPDITLPPVGSFTFNSSSASYLSPFINNGFYTITVFYHTDGISQTKVVQAVSGKISDAAFDLSGASSFNLSGSLTLNGSLSFNFSSFTVTISSIPGIVANAGLSNIATSTGAVISTSAARIEAFLEDEANFGKVGTGSVAFDSEGNMGLSRSWSFGRVFYGFINNDGSYQIRVPPGVYRVKPQANLDGNLANGLEVAPQEKVVVVKTTNAAGVDFTFSAGVSVGGTLKLPSGVSDTRPIGLVLTNTRGEPVGFTVARFLGANSASFEFTRVADGDYLIMVEDAGGSKAYAAKAKKITVKGAALSGQDIQLSPIGFIRGSLVIEQVKADASSVRTPITSNNKSLLPKGFKITAQANPWFEGGIFSAKEENGQLFLDANNQFVIENVLAGTYDVKFRSEDASYDSLAEGSLIIAPHSVSAVRLSQGQAVDLGSVALKPALSITGTCKDGSGNPVPNILVGAVPAQGSNEDKESGRAAVFTNAQGVFTLAGLSGDLRYYDFFVQPRGNAWGRFMRGKELSSYLTVEKRSIDIKSAAASSLNFTVEAASASLRGRLNRGTKKLSYPTGSLYGFPAAAVYLQKDGVQPKENPLGDITVVTDADDGTGASFRISGLSPGKYRLTAVSLGYASSATVVTAASGDVHIGTLTFATGGSLSGSIAKADGTSPNSDAIRFIAAMTAKLDSVVFGTLNSDEQTKTITGYSFSGFTPGATYQIMIQGSDGIVSVPEEGQNILFSSASEEKTLNITWKLPRPEVFSKFKRQDNGSYLLRYQATQALRKKTTADDDLTQIISLESGSGTLGSREISNDRRQLSAVYTPSAGETSFRVRVAGRTTVTNPEATDPNDAEFSISAGFNYQIGLDSYGESQVNNVDGGKITIEGDTSGMEFQPGSLSVDVSSNVRVTMAKTNEKPKPSQSLRYAPSAYTPGLLKAMAAAPDVSAMSAFYEILLPRGLSSRLSKAGTLTLSYSSNAVSDPSSLNIYWFNEGANAYFIQNANRTIDTVNQTITISVDHLSTFVVLSGSQEIIRGNAFAGGEVEVFNFPNPFDLKTKTLALSRATGGASITTTGTVIRFTLPASVSGMTTIDIFNIAGEHVRRIEAGDRAGGNYYYVDWDGKNDSGREIASGVYIGELRVGGHKKFFKMAVIK